MSWAEHGGDLDHAIKPYPNAPKPWLDLSTAVSPFSYPLDLALDDFKQLPSRAEFEHCQSAMAKAFNLPTQCVLPAAGSELIIRLLPLLFPGRRLVITLPTYADYQRAWQQQHEDVVIADDVLTYAQSLKEKSKHVYIVCNPNNPSGEVKSQHWLQRLTDVANDNDDWLIVDEAYADAIDLASLATGTNRCISLRSFGKFFGLPGLRLASVLGHPSILERVAQLQGVWGVSSIALKLGANAYKDHAWQNRAREKLNRQAIEFDRMLNRQALPAQGQVPLFRFIDSQDTSLWEHLMQQGIYTRQFRQQPGCLRIGLPGSKEDLGRLEAALSSRARRSC